MPRPGETNEILGARFGGLRSLRPVAEESDGLVGQPLLGSPERHSRRDPAAPEKFRERLPRLLPTRSLNRIRACLPALALRDPRVGAKAVNRDVLKRAGPLPRAV